MADDAQTVPLPKPPPASPEGVATLLGGSATAAGVLYLLIQLQTGLGELSGRVAVIGEQMVQARDQVAEVRTAQVDMSRDIDAIERRLAVLDAERTVQGGRK